MEYEQIPANRVLSGTWAEIRFNGIILAEVTKISTKTTVNREDVQMGLDVDSKITGLKGEGTLTMAKVYTRFEDVRTEILKGKDPRGILIAKLKDPDAEGGQTERWQIGNVALSEFGIEWEKGAAAKQEMPFTFAPTRMINLDAINPQ